LLSKLERDALKTRAIIYFNVETWSLLAPSPYQNFWLRAC